ncbi:hypothetical protein D3C75_813460 [compost metagenome]
MQKDRPRAQNVAVLLLDAADSGRIIEYTLLHAKLSSLKELLHPPQRLYRMGNDGFRQTALYLKLQLIQFRYRAVRYYSAQRHMVKIIRRNGLISIEENGIFYRIELFLCF